MIVIAEFSTRNFPSAARQMRLEGFAVTEESGIARVRINSIPEREEVFLLPKSLPKTAKLFFTPVEFYHPSEHVALVFCDKDCEKLQLNHRVSVSLQLHTRSIPVPLCEEAFCGFCDRNDFYMLLKFRIGRIGNTAKMTSDKLWAGKNLEEVPKELKQFIPVLSAAYGKIHCPRCLNGEIHWHYVC